MKRKIKITEQTKDKIFYTIFAYMYGGSTIGGYTQNRKDQYYLDVENSTLHWEIDDVHSKQKIKDIDLLQHTFKRGKKTYSFSFCDEK